MSLFIVIAGIVAIFALTFLAKKSSNTSQQNLFKLIRIPVGVATAIAFFLGMFFYAQPGYTYHTRTIWGQELAQSGVGFKLQGFGYNNAWKNAMSVQALDTQSQSMNAERESTGLSATLPSKRVVFLDQVDARVSATA